MPGAHLVTVDETLYGSHAEVGQLHVKQTAALLYVRPHGIIDSSAEVRQFEWL